MKINQNGEEREIYHIEIALTENQLKVLCEIDGDDEHDYLDSYKSMKADEYRVVTKDPSFDLGLGATINDILSLGFLFMKYLDYENKTSLGYEDLNWHPFRCKIPVVKEVNQEHVECEILETGYKPILFAKAVEKKEIDHVDNIGSRCIKCNCPIKVDIGDGLCVECWIEK